MDVDVAAVAHKPAQRVVFQKARPSRAERLADNNLSDVVLTSDTEQCFTDIGTGRGNYLGAELARQREVAGQACLLLLRKRSRLLDVRDDPGSFHRCRQPARVANQSLRVRTRADRDEQAIPTLPWPGDFFLRHDVAQIAIDMFGDKTQRHFAQSGEVAFSKEIFRRPLRALAEIHFSFGQACAQLLRC